MADGIYELHINSRDGTALTQDNEVGLISFQLRQSISIPTYVAQIALVSGKIPRTFYIIDSLNSDMTITIDAVEYEVSLSHGNPNALQLATELANVINAATGKSFTVSYSSRTNKYTFGLTQTTETDISITFGANTKLYRVLGFTNTTHTFTLSSGSFSLVSDVTGTLSSIPSCSIHLEGIIFEDSLTVNGRSHILHRQYFKSAPNGYEIIEASRTLDWKTVSIAAGHINAIIIGMKDSDGRIIDFNGVDWELTIYVKPAVMYGPPRSIEVTTKQKKEKVSKKTK